MSKFRFRLEVIRELRRRAQDAQRRVLADQVGVLDRVARCKAGWARERDDAGRGTRRLLEPSRLDVEQLRKLQSYRGWLDGKVVDARVEMDRQEGLVEQERAKLAEVARRLKVVEKLRERQWRRYQTQCRRAEQAEFDEAGLQGFVRRLRKARRPARDAK